MRSVAWPAGFQRDGGAALVSAGGPLTGWFTEIGGLSVLICIPVSGYARDEHAGSASHASKRPCDQQRPMASARRADRSNTARPMMLWPEARRSPSVGIAGATPTPSADTHATARPAAASSRRCRKRRRLSSGKLRQRPRRGDDRQGVRGHTGEGVGQHLDGVTLQQQRRGRRRQRHLRFEPRGPLRLIRPQAGAQPSGVIRVGHVDRIEVDADPGDDLGHRPRRDGPVSHDRRRQLHGR